MPFSKLTLCALVPLLTLMTYSPHKMDSSGPRRSLASVNEKEISSKKEPQKVTEELTQKSFQKKLDKISDEIQEVKIILESSNNLKNSSAKYRHKLNQISSDLIGAQEFLTQLSENNLISSTDKKLAEKRTNSIKRELDKLSEKLDLKESHTQNSHKNSEKGLLTSDCSEDNKTILTKPVQELVLDKDAIITQLLAMTQLLISNQQQQIQFLQQQINNQQIQNQSVYQYAPQTLGTPSSTFEPNPSRFGLFPDLFDKSLQLPGILPSPELRPVESQTYFIPGQFGLPLSASSDSFNPMIP
jgi:hypothetical protein